MKKLRIFLTDLKAYFIKLLLSSQFVYLPFSKIFTGNLQNKLSITIIHLENPGAWEILKKKGKAWNFKQILHAK